MPGMLMKFGWLDGIEPRPIRVQTAGASSVSARVRSSLEASAWMMPPPA